MEKTVKKGDKVRVHYTGKFEDGTVFDSSEECMHEHEHEHHHHSHEPLEVEVGAGYVIKGFDDALIGMKVGDKKTVKILPAEGYGEAREDMIIKVKREQFPPQPEPQVGMDLELTGVNGGVIPATITKVEGDDITIDANHPLAGKTLIFDLKLVEIL